MRAAAIRINAVSERDVRAVVARENRLRGIRKVLRRNFAQLSEVRLIVGQLLKIIFEPCGLKAIRRAKAGPSAYGPAIWLFHDQPCHR